MPGFQQSRSMGTVGWFAAALSWLRLGAQPRPARLPTAPTGSESTRCWEEPPKSPAGVRAASAPLRARCCSSAPQLGGAFGGVHGPSQHLTPCL